MNYLITIQEENGDKEAVEIYRQRVSEIDLGAIIAACNKGPKKVRSDKGVPRSKPATEGAK